MSTTLVGVFDDAEDARRARERLESSGIDRNWIRLQPDEVGQAAAEEDAGRTSTADTLQSTSGRKRRGFFAELFGIGDDDDEKTSSTSTSGSESPAGTYAEAVRRGNTVVTVEASDDSEVDRITEILESCGAIDVDQRVEHWKAGGYTRHDAAAPDYTPEQRAAEREKMLVVEEELKVGKRQVERGSVRVRRFTTDRPIEEQVTLREEHAVIDRERVDRPASQADMAQAFKDGTVEIRETAEEPVVSKSARVVEEVSVGKATEERTETVRDTVRRSDVQVEKGGGDGQRRMQRDGVSGMQGERSMPGMRYQGPSAG